MQTLTDYLLFSSTLSSLISAGAWLYASRIKISQEKAMKARERKAKKMGETPNYASVSLDDWDMSSTFAAQSKWNAIGAFFAAISILLQAFLQLKITIL